MPETTATNTLPSRGTLFGFDFGLARIGIAVGELETKQASALTTLHAPSNQKRFADIAALLAEWHPVAFVVGIPYYLDGQKHSLTTRCHRFANQLHGRFNLPVFTVDERLSSVAAECILADAGVNNWRARKTVLDAVSAQIILQNFLDSTQHAKT